MAFELYKKTRALSDEESVSISPVGAIMLSPALSKHLEGFEFAQLFFDSAGRRVGIKPVKKGEYSYRIIRTSHGRRAGVSGRAFLKSYNLVPVEKDKFKAISSIDARFENGMVVFNAPKA